MATKTEFKPKLSSPKWILVGCPNVGKTALYNDLTGQSSKEMNYPGSTVATSESRVLGFESLLLACDTPGITSSEAESHDERLAWRQIYNADTFHDALLFVIDPLQLGKQLVFFKQVSATFSGRMILVLNYGCCGSARLNIDVEKLKSLLKVPVLEVSAREKGGCVGFREAMHVAYQESQVRLSKSAFNTGAQPGFTEKQLCEDFAWAEHIVKKVTLEAPLEGSEKESFLDQIFYHPILGTLAFFLVMTLFFWSLFGLAAPFMGVIEEGVAYTQEQLRILLPPSALTTVFIDGVLFGLGSALVFVPQIFLLFWGLGLMEQTGFLARGALVVDKPLSKIGLSGRSFLPLLSGFACSIPALLAARNIPKKREKRLVQLVIPLMTCSARLPVYGILISLLLFGKGGIAKAMMMTAVYILSLMISCFVSLILDKCYKKSLATDPMFHIALPKWRAPSLGKISVRSLIQAKDFLFKVGPHIVWISFLFWGISHYPTEESSIAMHLGKILEPLFLPMGVDWRVGVALIFAFAAREVFVPALAVAFAFSIEDGGGLLLSLSQARFETSGHLIFTPSSVLGLIGFFMISLQCLSTVAVAQKEMKGWKTPLFMMASYTAGGYLFAVAIVQGLRFLGIA